MEISSASTLKGFAVIRREGVNPQPAGTEGVDGSESGISKPIADVIDISTEGRSFANQEENNRQQSGQGSSQIFGDNSEKPDGPTLGGQQSEITPEATITAAVLTGTSDDAIPQFGEKPAEAKEGSQSAPTELRQAPDPRGTGVNQELTDEEKQTVNELKMRDAEVRAHEQAHLAAAGQYASGGISYSYQKGPDGKQYAVGGEVGISMPSGDTPEETLRIARQVERAANAPASPSSADRAIAAAARARASEAMREMSSQSLANSEDDGETTSPFGGRSTTVSDAPNGQGISITGTGQPQNEPVPISNGNSNPEGNQIGRSTESEIPLFGKGSDADTQPIGGSPQNDEIGVPTNSTIEGSSSDNESIDQTGEDTLPELIELINGLDRISTTDDESQSGEVVESESGGNAEPIQSLLSLVDSL
jgi:hypothetical protein